uniref:signal peptidase complex catalytic subunit SEC11C-like isoform X2 n=1 Tax=Erigeron canadensis TaxID=72917 RepID=UPI001CB8C106|nr:signal peptidase complex catalytic subunit SEC11C-like isoform X2 [Erigeron canadensis]
MDCNWKQLKISVISHAATVITLGSEFPLIAVVSGSMEPGFTRGDLFLLYTSKDPIHAGEIVVFNVEGLEIPIVHRVIRVHEHQDTGEVGFLTKGDNNYGDDSFLYGKGQTLLKQHQIIGRAIWFLPYAGYFTILMTETPLIKYILVGAVGLLAIISRG